VAIVWVGIVLMLILHLQFADDTLLLGIKSWVNVRVLRAILVLFEVMSGDNVNFHKSMLVGVNIDESWLIEVALVLSCKIGRISFLYLSFFIGGDVRRLFFGSQFWPALKLDCLNGRVKTCRLEVA